MLRGVLILLFAVAAIAPLLTRAPSSGNHASGDSILLKMPDDGDARAPTLNAAQSSVREGSVELPRDPDGHFYADVQINGATVHMLVDTGATIVNLSREDAASAGIATSIGMNEVVGKGADGAIHGEVVRLERMSLGPMTAQGLEAVVLSNGRQSLLGQSFLRKFSSVTIEGDRMVLR